MEGKCIIISAPSGAGKTTIVQALLKDMTQLAFSISACSREPRGNEQNGIDYYFLGREGFEQRIAEEAFLEWEEVYDGMFYGTLKSELTRIWSEGKTVIFDVDVVGGIHLKQIMGEKALSIFIQPPSMEELSRRLTSRNTDSIDKINMRLAKAKQEIEQAKDFDVIVVNDQLELAIQTVHSTISSFINS
ncbi:MAG: guanylate kinase [Crocinitomicaceae bacterium]|nr:guanylate kinase [Crocinitomicaceae bacterium]MBP6033654.1 guanylate kinase [Crocinitomicaceae bacterium]